MLQLLVPRENKNGFYEVLHTEDTESNRELLIAQARQLEGSVVIATINHCTVSVIYGKNK